MKTCDRCKQSCEQGTVESYRSEQGRYPVLIQILCIECSRDDDMAKYRQTGVLCNNVISAARFYMQDVEYRTGGADGGWIEWMRGESRMEQRGRIIQRMREQAHLAHEYRKIAGEYEAVHAAVKAFERNVWFSWLKTYWNDTHDRGHKSQIAGLDMLLWGCAGRVVTTLRDPVTDVSVTVITDDSSDVPYMNIKGIDATAIDALRLLKIASDNASELQKNIKPDAHITM